MAGRTLLRPWTQTIWAPGQVKPNGVPRIDWRHPLAWGLLSYWFDTGNGFYIDLVSGQITTKTATGGTTVAPRRATQYGTGFGFTSTLTEQADPANARNQAWAAPYTFATGFQQIATPTTGSPVWFGLVDTGNNTLAFYGNTPGFSYGNNGAPNTTTVVNGTFYVMVASATAASAQNTFVNGVNLGATTSSTAYTGTILHYAFNSNGATYDNAGSPTECGAAVFFGAAWQGRALTQTEATLLYTDPYCFLVPLGADWQVSAAAIAQIKQIDSELPPYDW